MQALIRWSWVFGLVGALSLIGAASAWYVLGSTEGPATGFGITAAVTLALYLLLDRQRIGDTVSSRAFLYGSGSSLMVVMAIAIAVGVYVLARGHDRTWDLTREGDFTLSDQTVRFVGALDEDIRVLAFFRNESPEQRSFRDLVRRYQDLTDRLEVVWIDPLREPRMAEQHEITTDYGTLIFEAGERTRRVEVVPDEEKLTSVLMMLLTDEEHRVCWSLGHGEPDPDEEFEDRGLGGVVLGLEELNYTVEKAYIATAGVDQGCAVVVVARPEVDFSPAAREALAAYLAGGGRALVLLEPGLTPDLAADLERFGVKVADDVVVDLNPQNMLLGVNDPSFVVLTDDDFVPHPITSNLHAAVVLGMARSVAPAARDGLVVQPLLQTSENAWAETDLDDPDVKQDEDEVMGRIPVMVAVEITDPAALEVAAPEAGGLPVLAPTDAGTPGAVDLDAGVGRAVPADFVARPGGRLVVIGDSDFANNVFMAWGNNRDLFLNAVAWLVEEEDQIGERPETTDTLEVTALGEAMLCLITVFFVPGGAVAFAALVLLRRRFL